MAIYLPGCLFIHLTHWHCFNSQLITEHNFLRGSPDFRWQLLKPLGLWSSVAISTSSLGKPKIRSFSRLVTTRTVVSDYRLGEAMGVRMVISERPQLAVQLHQVMAVHGCKFQCLLDYLGDQGNKVGGNKRPRPNYLNIPSPAYTIAPTPKRELSNYSAA